MTDAGFWRRVCVRGKDECWPFVGRRSELGYGRLRIGRRDHYAHRHAYALANGAIPPGMVICHKCDWPPCCNPAHLIAAASGENIRDAAAKGRMLQRLTLAQVVEIKKLRTGGAEIPDLMRRFSVSRGCIRKHIENIPHPSRRERRLAPTSTEQRPHNTPIAFYGKAGAA